VHRVKPVFAKGQGCAPTQAAVFLHGRTISAPAVYDLQFQADTDGDGIADDNYSLMETLARRGIDTFASNNLGYGLSQIDDSIADPMDKARNASLPQCAGTPCVAQAGVCDCVGQPNNSQANQQGSTRYLNPNPLGAGTERKHTSTTVLELITTQIDDLVLIVDDVRQRTGLPKVNLVGYATGGTEIGRYLGDSDSYLGESMSERQSRVGGAIFIGTAFGGVPERRASSTWPLGVFDKADVDGTFTLSASCPGQKPDGIVETIWGAIRARDSVAASWGPTADGLARYPLVNRWGWTKDVAANITTPALIIHGQLDTTAPLAQSQALYNALKGPRRLLDDIACGSHTLSWEGCAGATCNGWKGPHATLAKVIGDFILTGLLFASPGHSEGAFETTADGMVAQVAAPGPCEWSDELEDWTCP
jgi:pimeloyl-ACP methyl ester carboxylesterase